MEFPITVKSVEWDEDIGNPVSPARLFGAKPGAWVSVRPVGDDKTYLGVMVGDYCTPSLKFNRETGVLTVTKSLLGNPAMWVPDLARVVMGRESWWGEIKSADNLRRITDADIENVWYVRALKALAEGGQ
jgi:hypothetical protein